MTSLRDQYDALVKKNREPRNIIRAQIKDLEDYTPRNLADFEFREAEITRLRGLL